MSEKYVKEILDKLEEIEKLHAKLRSLVPRAKNYETLRSTNMKDEHPAVNETDGSETVSPEQNPVDPRRISESLRNSFRDSTGKIKKILDSNGGSMKHLKKFKERSSNGFKRFRSNSIDYVTKQWQDKNEKIKNFLLPMYESDLILVTRAVQTTDDEVNVISGTFQGRRSTLEDVTKRLSERIDNIYDSHRKISIHGRGLGDDEPRRVRKTLFIPDKEAETLKIVSSARKIRVSETGKLPSPGSRKRKLSGKSTDIRLEQ